MSLLGQIDPWRHAWTPTWTASYWILAILGAIGITIVAICYLVELRGIAMAKRAVLILLRSGSLLLLCWMLLGWSWTPYAVEPPDLIVLLDSSRSMSTEDIASRDKSPSKLSRMAAAKSLLLEDSDREILSKLAEQHRLRIGVFGQATSWLAVDRSRQQHSLRSVAADADATRIGDAIEGALRLQRGRSAAALLLISDGVQTSGASLAEAALHAKAAKIPLHIIGLGEDRLPRDARIANLIYSPTAFFGDAVFIEADVEASGYPDISLRMDLNSPSGESITNETVTLRSGQATRIRVPVRPAELGDWKFTMVLQKPEGDANSDNNVGSGVIRVQEEAVRVLIVDRRPRYDVRFLVDVLSRVRKRGAPQEPAFEVKTFLQEGDAGLSQQDSTALDAFPNKEDLARFDVIVLGDIDPQLLGRETQRELLEAVTHRGAGLMILPSASLGLDLWSDQPLELLLPARASEIAVPRQWDKPQNAALTSRGAQAPFCSLGERPSQSEPAWQTLPPLFGVLSTSRLRPDVRVLVEASGSRLEDGRPAPVVTSHFAGAGKVLCHWSDEWWRWAAPATRSYYDQYCMQALRGLCTSKSTGTDDQYSLQADASVYEVGEAVRLSLQFHDERLAPQQDDGAVIAITSEAITRQLVLLRDEVRRDRFVSSVSDLPAGAYTASVIRPAVVNSNPKECRFQVTSRSNELTRLRADFTTLQAAALQSGGKFYTLDTAARLPSELPQGIVTRTTPLAPRSAWNLPVWAAFLVGLLTLEWFLRRAGGLL